MNPASGMPGDLDQAAIALNEMFRSLQRAGFSRREALELCKTQLMASITANPSSGDGGDSGR